MCLVSATTAVPVQPRGAIEIGYLPLPGPAAVPAPNRRCQFQRGRITDLPSRPHSTTARTAHYWATYLLRDPNLQKQKAKRPGQSTE
uniref:Uncharacterized protein n=1 Tax=Oryza sativa subsp. japonica TaxID=39947 RepID=Q6H6H6_ORYSJ|nr:hypothetical protein [Oryza sativa Japonica Group]BAD25673.1 hypothetical protein [Oryza sativa Japonica Group]